MGAIECEKVCRVVYNTTVAGGMKVVCSWGRNRGHAYDFLIGKPITADSVSVSPDSAEVQG